MIKKYSGMIFLSPKAWRRTFESGNHSNTEKQSSTYIPAQQEDLKKMLVRIGKYKELQNVKVIGNGDGAAGDKVGDDEDDGNDAERDNSMIFDHRVILTTRMSDLSVVCDSSDDETSDAGADAGA